MVTLQRLLACQVLDALESREHVLVAPGAGEALIDEVETTIAPTLPSVTPYLVAEGAVLGEVTNTFGDDTADEAVETMVEEIAEQLMESNHVDDIFAEDRVIRRDTFRAIREILLRYIRGDLELAEDSVDGDRCVVALDGLGYVVSMAAQQADELIIHDALQQAALGCGAQLASYDHATRSACFGLSPGSSATRLALEEMITEQLVELVDAEIVELPCIQQVLEIPEAVANHPELAEALATAAQQTQLATGCSSTCLMLDRTTLLASLTPLSEEDAESASEHFEAFLATLELALAAFDDPTEQHAPCSEQREIARAPTAAPSKRRASGSAEEQSVPAEQRPSSTRRQRAGRAKKRRAKS